MGFGREGLRTRSQRSAFRRERQAGIAAGRVRVRGPNTGRLMRKPVGGGAWRTCGTKAKVGLVPEGFLVVKAACLQRRSMPPGMLSHENCRDCPAGRMRHVRPAARSPCPGSEQALSGSPAPYACSQHPRAWTDSPTPRLARRRDTTDPAASARPSDRSSAESRCKSRFLANQGGIIGAGSRSGSFPAGHRLSVVARDLRRSRRHAGIPGEAPDLILPFGIPVADPDR